MPISREQRQVVLQRERGDPKVVVGNWCPSALELNEQPGVVFRRLAAGSRTFTVGFASTGAAGFIPALLVPPGSPHRVPKYNKGIATSSQVPNCSAGSRPPHRAVSRFGTARLSLPLVRIDLSLRRKDLIEGGVRSPLTDEVREIGSLAPGRRRRDELIQNHLISDSTGVAWPCGGGRGQLRWHTAHGVLVEFSLLRMPHDSMRRRHARVNCSRPRPAWSALRAPRRSAAPGFEVHPHQHLASRPVENIMIPVTSEIARTRSAARAPT